MSDFKPGDEVVCVAGRDPRGLATTASAVFEEGVVYVVANVILWRGEVGLVIAGMPSDHPSGAYGARFFRKVQRRDLSAWLATATKFEEPKRAPVLQPGDLHAAADAPAGGVALPLAAPGRSTLSPGASHE